MLIDIKDRLDQRHIYELLELSVFPDPDRIVAVVNEYKHNPSLHIKGYEDNEEIIGVIGYEKAEAGRLTIRHLAIHPDERGKGYGRGVVLRLLEQEKPSSIEAETDEESVNFYRSIGFAVQSLGEKYPGIERFRCVYVVDPDEEDED